MVEWYSGNLVQSGFRGSGIIPRLLGIIPRLSYLFIKEIPLKINWNAKWGKLLSLNPLSNSCSLDYKRNPLKYIRNNSHQHYKSALILYVKSLEK